MTYNRSRCYCTSSSFQCYIHCVIWCCYCISTNALRISSINLTVMVSGNLYFFLRCDRGDLQIAIYYRHFDVTIVPGCYYKIISSQPHHVMARICSGCFCFCSRCKGYGYSCWGITCKAFYTLLGSIVYLTIMVSGNLYCKFFFYRCDIKVTIFFYNKRDLTVVC